MEPNRHQPQGEFEQQGRINEDLRSLLENHFEIDFSMLIIVYEKKLLGYISSRFKGCNAEEIVQSVWIKAWEALQTYEPTRIRAMRFGPWLYTMAHNQALNVLKSSTSKEAFSLDTPEGKAYIENHLYDQSPLVEDEVLRKEELDILFLYITQLPKRYRQVIRLHYYADFSYPEIAQILNRPLNTVKSVGLRATKLLRLQMQKSKKGEQ